MLPLFRVPHLCTHFHMLHIQYSLQSECLPSRFAPLLISRDYMLFEVMTTWCFRISVHISTFCILSTSFSPRVFRYASAYILHTQYSFQSECLSLRFAQLRISRTDHMLFNKCTLCYLMVRVWARLRLCPLCYQGTFCTFMVPVCPPVHFEGSKITTVLSRRAI